MTPDWAAKPVTVPYAKFGDPQSLNLYAFVENGPVDRIDPDGHEDAGGGGGAGSSGDTSGASGDEGTNGGDQRLAADKKGSAQKPLVSVTVEGGVGAEEKVKIGTHEAKIGGAIKGEVTGSSKGVKVAAAAELSAEAGPVKAFSVRAEQVTRNEQGESEKPTVEGSGPGVVHGNGEASGTMKEFTVSISSYEGFGGGVSVTIRPQAVIDYALGSFSQYVMDRAFGSGQ